MNTEGGGEEIRPAFLTITEIATISGLEAIEEEDGQTPRIKVDHHPSKPISHEIKHVSDTFVQTIQKDSEVHICIRAPTALPQQPMRFALRLEEMGDEEEYANAKKPPAVNVDTHLTVMENHLKRIENEMHIILREADMAKERDSVYHTKTDAMHKAITFWPIVHVCILLATGFTQANHIVHFFKKRRII